MPSGLLLIASLIFVIVARLRFTVNLTVGWNELAKSTKLKASFIEMSHSEKNVINKSVSDQRLEGLAIKSRFSRSAIKWMREQLVS